MTYVAVAAGAAAVLGAGVSYVGSQKAAKTAAKGSDAAIAESQRQFDTIRGDNLGRINIGNQAINSLGAMYGYSPTQGSAGQVGATYGATPYAMPGGGSSTINTLREGVHNSALGLISPASGTLAGLSTLTGLFHNAHGDENRNLKAFAAESGVQQLPNGMLMLPDGSTFAQNQLKDVAGTWYGANHAPDGNQQDWQSRYTALLGSLQKTPIGQTATQGGGAVANSAGSGSPDYSAFFKSPDYTFRQQEGMSNIGNSFSASGGARSGNALKALAEFNSNLAAGEFGNYFNRQLALAGQGQAATGTSANAGIATGQITGNALQNAGDARASGVAGQYNAIGGGLSSLGQGLGYYLQNRQQQQNPYGSNPYGSYGPQAVNWGYGRIAPGSYA